MLFRHMTFSAAIGNVDDHLKNFWMLATASGYRLAPAFDLVPDISGRSDHTLAFQYSAACPSREQLRAVATQWQVRGWEQILEQVIRAVEQFAPIARKIGVRSGTPLESTRADVRRRLELLA